MVRRKGKSGGKYLAILVIVIVVIIIGILVAVNNSNRKRPPVSQYLEITHTISIGEFYNQNRTVKITYLGLNITAVGGDAHDLILFVRSQPEYPAIKDFIPKGESWEPGEGMLLRGYVTSLNEDDLFPVDIKIGCIEAVEEEVMIYLKPKDVVGTSYG